jgi:hypothetical protein
MEGINLRELEIGLKRLKKGKAVGSDGVANEMLKKLKDTGKKIITKLFNGIIGGQTIPDSWKTGRIKLLDKGKGKDRRLLDNKRPIAITSCIYKLFMIIIKQRMIEWLEDNKKFRELQNGFRKDRRTTDNIYIITQLIEAMRDNSEELIITFLDIKKAYDRVNRSILWERMEKIGLPKDLIQLIKRIYEGSNYTYQLGKIETDKVKSYRGLKQGCPMSPLLFLIYLKPLEDKIINSGYGINIENHTVSIKGNWINIPGILFADDIAIMEKNGSRMQALLDIVEEYGKESQIEFSEDKSKFMIMSGEEEIGNLRLGNKIIERTSKYDYLGITIGCEQDYLKEERKKRLSKLGRITGAIKNKGIYSYNRYEVIRILWKCVAVPGITYAEEVLVLEGKGDKNYKKVLESTQLQIGRIALGANSFTPKAGIQGEMGWSTFQGREANAKIKFHDRLKHMDDDRLAKQVFQYIRFKHKSNNTKLCRRVNFLYRKFNINEAISLKENGRDVIKETNQYFWKKEVEKLSSLKGIYDRKEKYEKVNYMDNDLGSILLFRARTGCLETNVRLSKFLEIDLKCDLCGQSDETVSHVILHCRELEAYRQNWEQTSTTTQDRTELDETCWRLGLSKKGEEIISGREIDKTKNLLEKWKGLKMKKWEVKGLTSDKNSKESVCGSSNGWEGDDVGQRCGGSSVVLQVCAEGGAASMTRGLVLATPYGTGRRWDHPVARQEQ